MARMNTINLYPEKHNLTRSQAQAAWHSLRHQLTVKDTDVSDGGRYSSTAVKTPGNEY